MINRLLFLSLFTSWFIFSADEAPLAHAIECYLIDIYATTPDDNKCDYINMSIRSAWNQRERRNYHTLQLSSAQNEPIVKLYDNTLTLGTKENPIIFTETEDPNPETKLSPPNSPLLSMLSKLFITDEKIVDDKTKKRKSMRFCILPLKPIDNESLSKNLFAFNSTKFQKLPTMEDVAKALNAKEQTLIIDLAQWLLYCKRN